MACCKGLFLLCRVVAKKFQEFAQKKKLKHAGDPDVRMQMIVLLLTGVI